MTGGDGPDPATDANRPRNDGPRRISNEGLFTVATAFDVAVGTLALAAALVPRSRRTLGLAILVCIGAYCAFGAVIV